MILRKIIASFLVILFVLLSIPNFLIYALSRSYLNTDFYRREDVISGTYDFVVDKTVSVLRSNSEMFKGYFQSDELKTQIDKVFTKQIFGSVLADFANQIDLYKQNSGKPMTLSLKVLRTNLLTVSNNLVYQIYQNLPTCSNEELVNAIYHNQAPQCVPKSMPYDQVVKPIKDNFENSIYNVVPEELSNVDQAVPIKVLVNIEQYKTWSFLILVILMGLLVLVVYGKTSSIVAYIGNGFLFGGVLGYVFAYGLGIEVTGLAAAQIKEARTMEFLKFLMNFSLVEIQKMALMFVGVGVLLWVIRFILKRTVEAKEKKG